MASDGLLPLPVTGGPWAVDAKRTVDRLGPAPKGIFSEHPGSTPKYATNLGALINEHADFRETMARMFVQVGSKEEYDKFVASAKELDPKIEPLARVLAGTNLAVGNKNDGSGTGYIDFLLQNVQHQFQEKMQVVETLADSYVAYFFGQGAPVFQYSGILINTKQDDQAHNMLRIYQTMIRGYQLARRKKILRLRYNNLIVSGAAFNFGFNLAAENEMACPFNFSLLVKSIIPLYNEYSGVVVNDSDDLFATESELAAVGLDQGSLGRVLEGSDQADVVSDMASEEKPTRPLTNAEKLQLKALTTGSRFDPNENKTDVEWAAEMNQSAEKTAATGRLAQQEQIAKSKEPFFKNPLFGKSAKDAQTSTP